MHAIVLLFVLGVGYVGHHVGDHWVQTDAQATGKDLPTWKGRLACLRHVLTLTATIAAVLAVAAWRTGLDLNWAHVAVALVFNGASHWVIDRRAHLLKLAKKIGKKDWLKHDKNAPYLLDQSAHILCLLITALIAV